MILRNFPCPFLRSVGGPCLERWGLEAMGVIKHFFILNGRGSTVLIRSFLSEPAPELIEAFYNRVVHSPPPTFQLDNFHVSYIVHAGLYFVMATDEPMSPTILSELLTRLTEVVADYTGRCSELAIHDNLAMVYELVDEALAFGCPQTTDATSMRHLIQNVTKEKGDIKEFLRDIDVLNVIFDSDINRPLAAVDHAKAPSELFFMLSESVEVTCTVKNEIQRVCVTGTGIVKSFLVGQPSVLVQLDQAMHFPSRIGSVPGSLEKSYDDIVFAPGAQIHSFDSDRSISFAPAEGLTRLFTYRTSRRFALPFTMSYQIENRMAKVVVMRVSLQSTYGHDLNAKEVHVVFQAPVEISNASCELSTAVKDKQTSEWDAAARQVKWHIPIFPGLQEYSARFRFIFDHGIPAAAENLLGPISLGFHIPGWLASGADVKTLAIAGGTAASAPKRWIRTDTTATCYTFSFG